MVPHTILPGAAMTSFTVETRIPYSVDKVFLAYRDKLPEVAAHVPNVKKVEILERKEEGDVVRFLNRWHAKAEVPGPLKSIISEDKLTWLDHAAWDASKKGCQWRLDITAFKDGVTCVGETRLLDDGPTTRMVIHGELTVEVAKLGLPIPRLLAGSIGKAVESFAVMLIKPNQEATGKAVERYLVDQKA
jgi:hypothetical protein